MMFCHLWLIKYNETSIYDGNLNKNQIYEKYFVTKDLNLNYLEDRYTKIDNKGGERFEILEAKYLGNVDIEVLIFDK